METLLFVSLIIGALMLAALDSLFNAPRASTTTASSDEPSVALASLSLASVIMDKTMSETPDQPLNQPFTIRFQGDHYAPAIRVAPDGDPTHIVRAFNLMTPRPVIFLTGGAGAMSEDDVAATRRIIEDGIAAFAEEHKITVIDGGTEAGVMQMIGAARARHRYHFPLLGVAPHGRIEYPGLINPDKEAMLDVGHSHFVLVESNEWGGESQMIVNLTRAIAGGTQPMIGVLINGGKIAQKDVYIATAQGDYRIPILVLEGSGRSADDIATAFRTGKTDQALIRAIIGGGSIKLASLDDGAEGMRRKLQDHFKL